jgi:hypothetical protein
MGSIGKAEQGIHDDVKALYEGDKQHNGAKSGDGSVPPLSSGNGCLGTTNRMSGTLSVTGQLRVS